MWRIGKYWINPRNITYVYEQEPGRLDVYFNATSEYGSGYCRLNGENAQELLNCLAQHTTTYPRLVTDEPPF